jgi:hypothetical protein
MKFIAKLTGLREDPSLVKGEVETKTLLKASLRKAAYTSEADVKPGTGEVWGNIAVRAFDNTTFVEFDKMELGEDVEITIVPRRKK